MRGYKVFNPDWTCRGKQYTCPGIFVENVNPSLCHRGMHFCQNLVDCFQYYKFDPANKVAEVIAHGNVITNNDKSCTDRLEIIRELSWEEVLSKVNIGTNCTGMGNIGKENSGDYNTGSYNSGNGNTGFHNSGCGNSGDFNNGDNNTGNYNYGSWNTGNHNIGDYNTGSSNIGTLNVGDFNSGRLNIGDDNIGSLNLGDYNAANYSIGCFNTKTSYIYMFNKITDWTIEKWFDSREKSILDKMPKLVEYIQYICMTDLEKENHPEALTTKGYIKKYTNEEVAALRQTWWDSEISDEDRKCIMYLPNFDKEIFEKITGIKVQD